MPTSPVTCVFLSRTINLRKYLTKEIARLDGQVNFVDHLDGTDPAEVDMAVGWHPHADAFDHYPNLKAVCSIGAGADSILNCPSLRDGIDVVRVVEPAQAQMMSGFVIWNVIYHQRRFGTYLQNQRDHVWKRLGGGRRPSEVPVGILGYGAIGARVASDLAMLGFPVKVWSRSAKPTTAGVTGFHGSDGLDAMLAEHRGAGQSAAAHGGNARHPQCRPVRQDATRRLSDSGRSRRTLGRAGYARCARQRAALRRDARCVPHRAAAQGSSVLVASADRADAA